MKRHTPLLLLLAVSSLLRVALVAQGGQLYWPDERLYARILDAMQPGTSWGQTFATIIGSPSHLGFSIIVALPAALHEYLSHAMHSNREALFKVPALFLSQISVISILLVHAIARRSGANRAESFVAALLTACTASMFYYSRHLLPYDAAMALALGALWLGIAPGTRGQSIGCGALAAAAFITYNGYWLMTGVVLLAHLVLALPSWRSVAQRLLFVATGFIGVFVALMLLQLVAGVPLLLGGMQRLAGTVTDGYAPEGFTLPWAYLWHAEHGLLLLWLAAAVALLTPFALPPDRRRVALQWAAAAALVFIGLATTSAVLHVFVAMGRQSRQLVPFLCLAAAPVVVGLIERARLKDVWVSAAAAVLVLQSGYNLREPLQQRFPRDLVSEISAKYGALRFDVSIEGPRVDDHAVDTRWVVVNMLHLYPPRGPGRLPSGRTVVRFPHPLEYLPYQYEGFDPIEREVLRANDISMRLIDSPTVYSAEPPAGATR